MARDFSHEFLDVLNIIMKSIKIVNNHGRLIKLKQEDKTANEDSSDDSITNDNDEAVVNHDNENKKLNQNGKNSLHLKRRAKCEREEGVNRIEINRDSKQKRQ